MKGIKATHEAVNLLIEVTRQIHGDSIAAYLAFMAIRLFEIHRVLKPTGSLYLHCDHTANGYLRQLLDGVFGKDNFRNEIIWCYTGPSNTKRWFPRKHDTVFFYGKSDNAVFNPDAVRISYKALNTQHRAGSGVTTGIGGKLTEESVESYRDKGKVPEDYWLEDRDGMTPVGRRANERTGYPTQKPMALAERIIKASTNPGDVVLDCFAGCAYTALAAERIRQSDPEQARIWAACDINPRAWTVFKRQFNRGGDLPLLTCNDRTTGQQVMGSEPEVTIHGPAQLPTRTEHSGVEVKPLRPDNRRPPGSKYHRDGSATTLLNKDEMLRRLLGISHGRAWCCGYRSAGTDGGIIPGNYELDHILPKSKGGDDEIYNRAPLCPRHNGRKGNRDITLDELRVEVAFAGELAEGMTPQSLIRLDDALRQAQQIFAEEYQRKYGKPFI